MSQEFNREMKRMMKRRERTADRVARRGPRRERTRPLEFLRQVRDELGRVSWPTRGEVFTYTIVVLVSVTFFMSVIALMDFGFSKAVLWVIEATRGGSQ